MILARNIPSPAVAGEGNREAVEGARLGSLYPHGPLRLASLDTSPANAGEEKEYA